MRRLHRSLIVLIAVGSSFTAGCQSPAATTVTSRELSTAQFDDVPAPTSFRLDRASGRTYSYAEGGRGRHALRMGRLVYDGPGTTAEVLAWYRREMPRSMHGWDAGTPVDGAEALVFSRNGEVVLVTARRSGERVALTVERNTPEARAAR